MGELIAGATVRTLRVGALAFTAYELGEGPPVLLVHGFPDTPATWRHLAPALAGAGFRAVAVTCRGYEPGSTPADGDFGLAALVDDVIGWLDALGAARAHLVGHDWGSSLVQLAAAKAPHRVASLTILAVAHPAAFAALLPTDLEQVERSWYLYLLQRPDLPELLIAEQGLLEHFWRRWSPGWEPDAEALAAMRAAFADPQVAASALAWYRRAFDPAHARWSEAAALLATPIAAPVLGLAGARDGCVAAELFLRAMPAEIFRAGRELAVIPGAGHFLHLERPELVGARVTSWIARAPAT
ncbi:alpha/beta fold hydrolase [Phenylobacterium sp.]|uniref:alpha/beta fold hydrolase n=1 Tax=Phenylobacterium sp. TaxID=1871053 RepID=UPI0025CEF199|nr:alpha/beta fold hydrolase [Phenylobacterium sp.]MBX3481991.1 alpha/beta fold hydrolase [Phenylobacterium sp.]MCW5761228.1 alpha/beta fold hydrolase [Phenylobacterium sp.]